MLMNFLVFIFGLLVGSFLNVVIYRVPKEESIVVDRSHCPECETDLQWFDLIPVFSFLSTKGECRYCGTDISWQYPLVEILTGLLFLGLYFKLGLTIKFGALLILICLLISSSVIDYRLQIIPNRLTYFGIIIGLIFAFIFNYISLKLALWGLIIPSGFLLLIALITRGGMGIGDVKFAAMIGTFIGPKLSLLGIFIGAAIGSLVGIVLLAIGEKNRKSKLPFGPLIAIGTLIMIFWGPRIIDFYFEFLLL